MNLKIFFLALLALNLSASSVFALQNNPKLDSLVNAFSESSSDSLKIRNLDLIAYYAADAEESIFYTSIIDSLCDVSGEYELQVRAKQFKCNALRSKGHLNATIEVLYEALEITELHNMQEKAAEIHMTIGSVFMDNDESEKALVVQQRAIETFKKFNEKSVALCIAYINQGFTYAALEEYDSALYYYGLIEKIQPEGFDKYVGYVVGNIASVKLKQGLLEEAEAELQEAIQLLEPYNDNRAITDFMNQLAMVYEQKGQSETAVDYAKRAVTMAVEIDQVVFERDGAEVLYRVYEKLNRQDSALKYYQQFIAARDSVINTESVRRLANQRADFEINLKQAEVDLANEQKENRQILAITMAGVALLTAIFLVNFYLAYQKRKRLAQRLEALNATKDKFFSIVSHDLRGPISAFNGISGIIRGYLKQKSYDELEEMTDVIDKSANSLSDLLDNLLNWAVQQQGQVPYNPVPLDLNQTIETTLGIFESVATAKGITLSNELGRSIFVVADKDTIMTIFRNLVGNALKFTESGGKIWVEAETRDARVHVKVHDTGVGMTEEQVEKLFRIKEERSYGTDGETGLGVGLQLVNEFVTLNNGSLTVESTPDEGSVFIVSLPVPDVRDLKT